MFPPHWKAVSLREDWKKWRAEVLVGDRWFKAFGPTADEAFTAVKRKVEMGFAFSKASRVTIYTGPVLDFDIGNLDL